MNKQDLISMAERCEAASGPDRELDAAVMKAFGYVWHLDFGSCWWGREGAKPSQRIYDSAAVPTASLDAAMTLVPEGWSVALFAHPDVSHVDVYRLGDVVDDGKNLDRPVLQRAEVEQAATPALALTAACLRAIANGAEG